MHKCWLLCMQSSSRPDTAACCQETAYGPGRLMLLDLMAQHVHLNSKLSLSNLQVGRPCLTVFGLH